MQMRGWFVVLALVAGCERKDKPTGSSATGSGSATAAEDRGSAPGSGAAVAAAGSGSAAGSGAAAAGCTLDGNYRLRFASNGTTGWWLRLAVTGNDVKPTGAISMLGLDEQTPTEIARDDKACTLTIKKKTEQAGDLVVALQVAATKVTGTVSRTDPYGKGSSPITGTRDVTEKFPDCVKPGVYTLAINGVKKWKLEGSPRGSSCKEMANVMQPHVRVDMLDGQLLVDEVKGEAPYEQEFQRATLTKTADCEFDLGLEVQDFKLVKSHVVFAGDKITGKAIDFTFEVMEDGEAGENQWSCHSADGDVEGKRVAD